MPQRYKELIKQVRIKFAPAQALKESTQKGYKFETFKADLMAGIVVGTVAIPLGMALAIATGVAPQYGLYTVVVAGMVVALLGGSRCQVTGPTAAFVVILAPIVQQYGLSGLLISGFLAGLLLLFMGLTGMGRLIEFIPHPVVTGFTSGIAVVIATIQLKDLFGLTLTHNPESYFGRVKELWMARGTWVPAEFAIGVLTLLILIYWPRVNKKIPPPLVALNVAAVVAILLKKFVPGIEIATIGSRFSGTINGNVFHGIPALPPMPVWPWSFPDPTGHYFSLSVDTLQTMMSSAFAIAMLGAIESLLSAVVADGMAQTHHDPDVELFALGIGNMICPFFGGIPATGAIARTATNIRYGARTPLAAVIHALFVLGVVLALAPLMSMLPMSSLAALLILVAYNMSEVKHFLHILKVAPVSDVVILMICFSFTVIFDMVIGVTAGVMLAALLLIKRITVLTSTHIFEIEEKHPHLSGKLPKEILLYEIAGPLFFGAAQNAVNAIGIAATDVKVVIFSLDGVPAMDVSGLVALETAIQRLHTQRRTAILVGVHGQPENLIRRSGLLEDPERCCMCGSLPDAVNLAKQKIAV